TACREAFALQENAEVTAEANPGDITRERLEAWARLGVNRLSVGVQSLDDGLLEALTRRHTAAEALRALALARQAGFENLSLDLIYGLPAQTLAQWKDTLERALEAETPHLSLYGLTVEEGTPLWQAVESGEAPRPDPDLAADMYVLAEELLAEAGYEAGLDTSIVVRGDVPLWVDSAVFFQEQWAKIGVDARVETVEFATSAKRLGCEPLVVSARASICSSTKRVWIRISRKSGCCSRFWRKVRFVATPSMRNSLKAR
ncbi:MAG: radical SAM protein, partial [Chloroflexi bacterium]|nr:radical SAM protein [Chloroflexota bacterium]